MADSTQITNTFNDGNQGVVPSRAESRSVTSKVRDSLAPLLNTAGESALKVGAVGIHDLDQREKRNIDGVDVTQQDFVGLSPLAIRMINSTSELIKALF